MKKNYFLLLFFFSVFSFSQKNNMSIVHTSTVSNSKISYVVGKIYVIPEPQQKKEIPKDEKKDNGIKIYPNPVLNILSLETEDKSFLKQITIYSIDGKLLYYNALENNSIDISFLKQGTYIIELDNDKTKTYKIIKA